MGKRDFCLKKKKRGPEAAAGAKQARSVAALQRGSRDLANVWQQVHVCTLTTKAKAREAEKAKADRPKRQRPDRPKRQTQGGNTARLISMRMTPLLFHIHSWYASISSN
jgi:hypothetical protein